MKLLERYLLAVDKCYVQSLNDPEAEPYKSKYEARKLFEELHAENIDEESDEIKKEFDTLDLIDENNKIKFIIKKPDEYLYEPSENVVSNENLPERTASFKRCWIKYAINLLSDSSDRLLQAADRDVTPNEIVRSLTIPKFEFKLSLPSAPMTCSYVLDYEQARQVFLFAMEKINSAKSYYVLDGFVTDHVELCQDTSQLYSKLVFFESNIDRKCKMYKRRIDLLSSLCKEISEEHYLYLVRQLLFELGECYSILLDLKLEQKEDLHTIKIVEKISHLIQSGISAFERFLTTMNDKKTNEKPETYADEYIRPVLLAHFYMGRFHSKSTQNRLEHIQQSLNQYKTIVDYVEKHPNALEHIEQEYTICKEMTNLLPLKLEKLRQAQ
ncbi:unnamed protein product [Rotaria magnacalcarata]|uniref:KIF-binding protein n=1 Tax=Rotaria magnacalcarata TaxID=392030 RepID=A0A8S2MWV8_9BILA|nr:unnamed protein product [Rotaria magnacalcarata]